MAGRGRGFTNERHAPLKAGVAAVAVAGFAVAWAGFAKSHEDVPGGSGDATAVAPAAPIGAKPAGGTRAPARGARPGGPGPSTGSRPATSTAPSRPAWRTRSSTSSRCAAECSAPIRVASSNGSPMRQSAARWTTPA
ncbi:MAG TPA: hypothetical protein PKA49_08835, partial [Tepidiformaceae bacterium]|nr:hypothetical protein [Tepidiformaceae bacterium]